MARKSRTSTPSPRSLTRKPTWLIPEPFQSISASARASAKNTKLVPTLILRGPWLKALGFPIGASAFLTTHARGELTLRRLGLRLPARLRIVGTTE